jgi:hypothetical protein
VVGGCKVRCKEVVGRRGGVAKGVGGEKAAMRWTAGRLRVGKDGRGGQREGGRKSGWRRAGAEEKTAAGVGLGKSRAEKAASASSLPQVWWSSFRTDRSAQGQAYSNTVSLRVLPFAHESRRKAAARLYVSTLSSLLV